MPKRPGNGDVSRRTSVPRPDVTQACDERQIFGELRLLELGTAAAPIAFRETCDAFARHGAGQKTRGHRRANDDADLLQVAEGQNFLFDLAADQGIRRLERGDWRDALRYLHLFDIKVRNTDPADLPRLLELCHCLPAFFEFRGVIYGPVDLIEVNRLDPQPAQAVLTFGAD